MSPSAAPNNEFLELMYALAEGRASVEQADRLEELMWADPANQARYVEFMLLVAGLHRTRGSSRLPGGSPAREPNNTGENGLCDILPPSPPAAIPPRPSMGPGVLTTPFRGTVGYFSAGWPAAYLVATLVLGVGLLIGSLVPASQPARIAKQPSVPVGVVGEPAMESVGRITGMVDCKWAGIAADSPGVVLGRRYELAAGLMEITYDTGAKVILQGPASFEVESKNGGFMPVGKLTGKVENEAARGFSVRTPKAVVTDLGTEFGVDVSKDGNTTSHVYRGSVRLQVISRDGKTEGNARVLHENESARVENRGGGNRIAMLTSSAKPADFVREIPKQSSKILDLVDVVAGGNGFSGRRNRGIDPRNGRTSDALGGENPMFGDKKYHRVEGLPFVDGVFIPHGGAGPVRLDSAGHVFDDFPGTDNKTSDFIWAGPHFGKNSAELAGIDYASPGHAQLALCANKGITFDLAAIRRANPDCKLVRFRAVTGNTEHVSDKGEPAYADVWVFVDGQVQFRRREINRYNGAMRITIPIHDTDRFLTLVATDGGNGYWSDLIIFGDPQLELVPVKAAADLTLPRKVPRH